MSSRGRPLPRRPASGRFVPVAAALAGVAAFHVCAPRPARIVLLFEERTPYWSAVEQGARTAAAAAGVELAVHLTGSSAPSTEVWPSDDGVGVAIVSSGIALATATRPEGVGIVVVGPHGPPGVPRVDSDHTAAGEQAGTALAAIVDDGQDVLVLARAPTDASARERERAAVETLRLTRPRAAVRTDRPRDTGDEERIRELLQVFPEARAAFAPDVAGALAFLSVLEEEGRLGQVRLVGCGAEVPPDIAAGRKAGYVAAWVLLSPEAVGRGALQSAARLLAGESPPSVLFTAVTSSSDDGPAVGAGGP